MDNKRLITLMLISFAVIFGWQVFVHQVLYPMNPHWRRPGQPVTPPAATTAPATQATQYATTTTTPLPTTAATSTAPQLTQAPTPTVGPRIVSAATQPSVVTLGDAEGFPIRVRLSSQGAGLDAVTLKQFEAPPTVTRGRGKDDRSPGHDDYVFQQPVDPSDPFTRAMATRSVTVNGAEVKLADVHWTLEKHDTRSATFAVDLGPVRIRKIYELHDKTAPDQGYELSVRHEFEATPEAGGTPQKVKLSLAGPVTPPREHERGMDLQIIVAHDDGYGRAAITHHMLEEYGPEKPSADITKGEDGIPLLWAGTSSVYFTALLRPEPLDPNKATADYVGSVTAFSFNPQAEAHLRKGGVTLDSTELTVTPGSTLSLPTSLFLGPRWRELLKEPHYAAFPRDYDQSLVMRAGPCGFCTFDWLINGLVWLLGVFHMIFRDWGLAIICLVVLVRGLLHPITKKSQVSMLRMGKLGPEIERLKKHYGDDKDGLNKAMMQLYKDQGIGMYLGCLPMFLQMPIWIALWSALNTTFELRQEPFLYGLTWIDDLARPDALIDFGRTFTLPFGMYISSLNILPILLAIVFYLQYEFTPKPPATTPEQETQQKMMTWMSLLFPIFLYPTPSGLNLYILTSTTIGIIESKRIRDHIKQKEEEEKAGRVIIDAPKSMKKKRDEEGPAGAGAKKPKGPKGPRRTGIAGWLDDLKAKAEEIQREADRQRGK